MSVDLKERVAIVTGASSGLGYAIARKLAAHGVKTVLAARNKEKLDALAAEITKKGGTALACQTDVTKEADILNMIKMATDKFGRLDILVNNAGIDGKPMVAADADLAEWRRVLEINLFGTFYCAREALKRMLPAKRGVILNMSSVHEVIPWSGYSAYSASKAGLSMMTRTLAQEAAPSNVRVLALAPGAIKTPINQSVWGNAAGLADLNLKIPMGRMGETAEIARMATVLVSDLASYATGTTIFVDGGMSDYADFSHGG
jgi:NAD(P)-dependent dehydrogenase (short-subunit alcohol dehydrogenase family)